MEKGQAEMETLNPEDGVRSTFAASNRPPATRQAVSSSPITLQAIDLTSCRKAAVSAARHFILSPA